MPAVAAVGVQPKLPAPKRSRAIPVAIVVQVWPLLSETSADAVQAAEAALTRAIWMPETIGSPIFFRRSSLRPVPPVAVTSKVRLTALFGPPAATITS